MNRPIEPFHLSATEPDEPVALICAPAAGRPTQASQPGAPAPSPAELVALQGDGASVVWRRRLRRLATAAFALIACAWQAQAGSNEHGSLVLHANPQVHYTTDTSSYCGQSGVADCAQIVTGVPLSSTNRVIFALAAFPQSVSPSVAGVSFGLSYDDALVVMSAHGTCADFELTTGDWPNPGSGTALVWNQPQVDSLIEIYWFAAYCYAEPATLALSAHPTQFTAFATNDVPAVLDEVEAFGEFAFGGEGSAPCPNEEGGFDLVTNGLSDEEEGEGDQNPPPPSAPFTSIKLPSLSVSVTPAGILSQSNSSAAVAPLAASYLDSDLRSLLAAVGVVSVVKAVPWSSPEDTTKLDFRGLPVPVPDISHCFTCTFASAEAAEAAIPVLQEDEMVISAVQETAEPVAENEDPVFYNWNGVADPQWYLQNTGRGGSAVVGADVGAFDTDSFWPVEDDPELSNVMIGVIDVGLADDPQGTWPDSLTWHEDLNIVGLSAEARTALSKYPQHLRCGEHATKMAGLAGAITGNLVGIKGTCTSCDVLDIESCSERPNFGETCEQRTCAYVTFPAARLEYALDEFGSDVLRVINHSVGPSELYYSSENVIALARAFRPIPGQSRLTGGWHPEDSCDVYRLVGPWMDIPHAFQQGLPEVICWPNQFRSQYGPETTTGLLYGTLAIQGPPDPRHTRPSLMAICRDVSGCVLERHPYDPSRVRLIGYNMRNVHDGVPEAFLRPVEDMAMSLTYLSAPGTAAVTTQGAPELKVHRNRGADDFTILFSGRLDLDTRVEVADVSGRCLWRSAPGALASQGGYMRWDRRTTGGVRAPSGVYFVSVSTTEGRSTRKVVVLP
ncbi:MAG: S8 family peptidase [Candidatus Eisenbacteria bacterium]|nr:S8 family peptidase [Candidatus Eisenbacteria bacterium]